MECTLFMIHGSGAGAWTWENFIGYFSNLEYQCVALDLPYHHQFPMNMADPRLAKISLRDYAQYLEDAIREMAAMGKIVGPLILMGHSMGGLLAQMLASRDLLKQRLVSHQHPLTAMVLLASAPPLGIDLDETYAPDETTGKLPDELTGKLFEEWEMFKGAYKPEFSFYEHQSFNKIPEGDRLALYHRLGCESGRVMFEVGYARFDPHKASYVEPSQVTCPVLALVGNEDERVTPRVVRKIAERYNPHSECHEFTDHAHWLLLEPQWEEVAQYIDEWLKKIPE